MNSAKSSKKIRAYTCYNLFFQLEREYILQTHLGHRPDLSKTDKIFDANDITNYQGPSLPSRYRNLILAYDWHIPGKLQRRRRSHRRSHGLISFHELNDRISGSWKVVDDETRNFCTILAAMEANKYKHIIMEMTSTEKSTKKKHTHTKAKRKKVEAFVNKNDLQPKEDDMIHSLLAFASMDRSSQDDITSSIESSRSSAFFAHEHDFDTVDMTDDEIIKLWKTTDPITTSLKEDTTDSTDTKERMSYIDDEYERFKALPSQMTTLLGTKSKKKRNCFTACQA